MWLLLKFHKPSDFIFQIKNTLLTTSKRHFSLNALTIAALALPFNTVYATSDEEASFQYGRYTEGARDLLNVQSGFKPIKVDSIQTNTKLKLSDRVRLAFNYTQDTWSGATPITTAPLAFAGNRQRLIAPNTFSSASPYLQNVNVFVDKNLNPLQRDSKTGAFTSNNQLVHTLSTASPETRKQGDLHLGYDWDEMSLDTGAGTSVENDYNSSFGTLSGRIDVNQKLTSLNFGSSYSVSNTTAMLDHDAAPYIEKSTFGSQIQSLSNGVKLLTGKKQDWSGNLGITQILNKSALLEGDVSYTASNGYMSNPYKTMAVLFVDPNQKIGDNGVLNGSMLAFLDHRPQERNQWTENLRYIQHIEALEASLHLDYRFYHDDWGINAHTFSSDWIQPIGGGWSITPRVRYYSQNGTHFYKPYLLSKQAANRVTFDAKGNPVITNYNPALLPQYYSSDYRLSAYGALSGGLTVNKKFAKGLELQAGVEYYTHAGSLKLGGGGEGSYADFNGYLINAELKVDLATLATVNASHSEHEHTVHHHAGSPAGVMFDHVLPNAGDVMIGYRYQYANQGGIMQNGLNQVTDATLVNNACVFKKCFVTPNNMSMDMHMLDLMYAPTDWLTLMLMPQFMDMHMTMRSLDGAPPVPAMTTPTGAAIIHSEHEHTTGGVGDTGVYALFNLFKLPHQQLNLSLGGTVPTGDFKIHLRDTHRQDMGFIHYGMQLGSGTWDFKPALTYIVNVAEWELGTQLNGTKRLESSNNAGFALGDIFQATSWASYSWTEWLATSLRGIYTQQGALRGAYNGTYNPIGAMDYGTNYGGQLITVGLGVNTLMLGERLQGNRLSFEWLQPVYDKVNGYQLPQIGALTVTWGYAF